MAGMGAVVNIYVEERDGVWCVVAELDGQHYEVIPAADKAEADAIARDANEILIGWGGKPVSTTVQ